MGDLVKLSMADKVAGYLEVGCNDNGEVVINHPDIESDKDGVGHIVFSPNQARALAKLLIKHANSIEHRSTCQAGFQTI